MNNSTQQAIEQYYAAWRAGEAEQFPFTEDFSFDGPILSVTNPDEFRGMARQFGPMVKEVKILEASYQSDKAFVMVEFTTNLSQWETLGVAVPKFEFTDTNAPALPQRFYRLHRSP